MAFTDGLDYWELAGSFPDAGQSHGQDYSCAAAERSAVLASAVPEPSGSAVLVQTIYADDYRGRTVTFRGQLRTTDVAGQAGLHLAAGRPGELPGADLRDRGGSSLTGRGSSVTGPGSSVAGPGRGDWAWHEVTMPVPQQTGVLRFGIWMAGPGSVELRDPELSPARPETAE
jgi:hypothetical protein